MTGELSEAVRTWFRALERCVERVDYGAAEPLFAEDVVSFGTRATLVNGRDTLRAQQWSGIWPNVRAFRFLLDQLHCDGDGDFAWAVVPWTSTGFDESHRPYDRPGRATVVFRKQGGEWRAVHSHFSLNPGTPQRTFGPA